MAPELFDESVSYGTEVDIWAFGAMAYELASGQPPNVAFGMDFARLGNHLKHHSPRLDGNQHSAALKDIVDHCFQGKTIDRPSIQQIQAHPYVSKTEKAFPTSSLSHLVRAFKPWEPQGGERRSLFSAGGARGQASQPAIAYAFTEDWKFNTSARFEQQVFNDGGFHEVCEAYGSDIEYNQQLNEPTTQGKRRDRRRRPQELHKAKAPLAKLFDPSTLSSYDDNSKFYYGRFHPTPIDDLPLRDHIAPIVNIRESLIDLDACLDGNELSSFTDFSTIRAHESSFATNCEVEYPSSDSVPATRPSTGAPKSNSHRRTQYWKFPFIAAAAFEAMGTMNSPFSTETTAAMVTEESFHQQMVRTMAREGHSRLDTDLRASVVSLIELDSSLAEPLLENNIRPSTSHSSEDSITGSDVSIRSPFDLEEHTLALASDQVYSIDDVGCCQSTASFATSLQSRLLLPRLPDAPEPYILQGQAIGEDIKKELRRMALSLGKHLRNIDSFLAELANDEAR